MCHKNERIVTHLMQRFKERHGIELTKARRLMLIKQIQTGVGKQLYLLSNGRYLYRVMLYSNETMNNVNYTVIYCPKMKQIMTAVAHALHVNLTRIALLIMIAKVDSVTQAKSAQIPQLHVMII